MSILLVDGWSGILDRWISKAAEIAQSSMTGEISASKKKELLDALAADMRKAGATVEQIADAMNEMLGHMRQLDEENQAKSAIPTAGQFKTILLWGAAAVVGFIVFQILSTVKAR